MLKSYDTESLIFLIANFDSRTMASFDDKVKVESKRNLLKRNNGDVFN